MQFKQFLLRELKRRGVKRIFGIPGRENESILFNEVEGIEYITTRVEFNAGLMADFLGRFTNTPQVCFSTMGPGATNMVTAIASAMLNHSPLIFFSTQIESDDIFYNLAHQCVNQKEIMEPITKWSYELKSPNEIVWVINKAFDFVMTEPIGPVHIAIPVDFLKVNLSINLEYSSVDNRNEEALINNNEKDGVMNEIYGILHNSQSPIVLIGQEVIRLRIEQKVLEFCSKWDIPFITAANAKGISNFEDPLNYGSASCYMEGILKYPALKEIFSPADLLICIGYQYVDDLLPKMWHHGLDKTIINISSVNPGKEIMLKLKPNFSYFGDVPILLDFLIKNPSPKRRRELVSLKNHYRQLAKIRGDTNNGFTPLQVINTLNGFLDNNTILVTDIGFYRHHAILFSNPSKARKFFTDTGLSTFGSGLPAAAAIQLECPKYQVILIAGDGGFHSGSCDLETLVRCKLPIIMVILNSSSYELINYYQKRGNENTNSQMVTFSRIDFVKLAEANGCKGVHAYSIEDLEKAIQNHDRTTPLLIELLVKYEEDEFKISF